MDLTWRRRSSSLTTYTCAQNLELSKLFETSINVWDWSSENNTWGQSYGCVLANASWALLESQTGWCQQLQSPEKGYPEKRNSQFSLLSTLPLPFQSSFQLLFQAERSHIVWIRNFSFQVDWLNPSILISTSFWRGEASRTSRVYNISLMKLGWNNVHFLVTSIEDGFYMVTKWIHVETLYHVDGRIYSLYDWMYCTVAQQL